jgi:hypothetical protein
LPDTRNQPQTEHDVSAYHPSAQGVLEDLRNRYPETKFLALGQTVWWDEPMKATLRRMLDELGLGGTLVLGVHDTDYFAKAHVSARAGSRFELLPHNDGSTKDLWSAAGEISRLFGSETFPTRQDYHRRHVPLKRLAANQPEDPEQFIDGVTEAWGWRGLVYTGSRDLIVHRLPLADMGGSLDQMLAYGFEGVYETLVDGCCREEARQLAERLLQMVADFRDANPGTYLSNLYRYLLPHLFELMLGAAPQDIEVDCTGHLLKLNPETAGLPRFEFVDLFLNEKTRALAARAYNEAVTGSEIYALDRFGLGALPFDLVLPRHGRGTLRVTLRAIHVETRNPIRIPLKRPITSIHDLAEVLTRELGDHVTLVGKAVALVSMLAREFLFVFNEEGSGYVTRTRRMNDILIANGVPLHMHPIVRLRYHTWDAMNAAGATLALPDHLASTFGQRQIPAQDFSAKWRTVVEEQTALLKKLESVTRPRDLMAMLADRSGGGWSEVIEKYDRAKDAQREQWNEAAVIDKQVRSMYEKLAEVKREIVAVERTKGDHYRSTVEWTPEALAARAGFDQRISVLLEERRNLLDQIGRSKSCRLAIERGTAAEEARQVANRIEIQAGLARLELVRNAVLTCSGLVHTQHRPAAWWLPMVDRTGQWFDRVAKTTEVYLQPLLSDQ